MRIYSLLLLTLPLLVACGTTSKEEKAATTSTARHPGTQPKKAVTKQRSDTATQPVAAAEFRGSVQPHPMKFERISEQDMQRKIEQNQVEPALLLGRFLLGFDDDYRSTLLYYRSPSYPEGWLLVHFEPAGEWLAAKEVTLDTVRLEPAGPPAVLATFHSSGSLRHWSITNEGINIIDASREPVLVLTAGTASHEYAYSGDEEADTTDEATANNSVETVQSQLIAVRKQLLVVEPAEAEDDHALGAAPPGTYRYRRGKMTRLNK